MKVKNNLAVVLFLSASLMMAACGGEKEKKEEKSGSDFMKESTPVYDAKAIDANAPVVEITIKAMGNTMADMSYDQTELTVKAGSTIKLTLLNESKDASMQHNFVLIDKDAMQAVADAGLKAGVDNQFVPNMVEVLIASKLTGPGEKHTITFPAPPVGEYKYICTYPGHYSKMNGKFIVQ